MKQSLSFRTKLKTQLTKRPPTTYKAINLCFPLALQLVQLSIKGFFFHLQLQHSQLCCGNYSHCLFDIYYENMSFLIVQSTLQKTTKSSHSHTKQQTQLLSQCTWSSRSPSEKPLVSMLFPFGPFGAGHNRLLLLAFFMDAAQRGGGA